MNLGDQFYGFALLMVTVVWKVYFLWENVCIFKCFN